MARACILLPLLACTNALPVSYVVADTRVLAIVAEPPEVAPGEHVTITTYLNGPANMTVRHCPDRTTICQQDEVDAAGPATEISPGIFTFSSDYVASAVGWEFVFVRGATVDALKRVVVSNDQPKNKNPTIKDIDVLSIDGTLLAPPLTLSRAQTYRALAVYEPETAIENFQRVHYDGTTEPATEEALLTWSCAPSCALDRELTYEFQTVRITPSADTLSIYVVMRDSRGGEAFRSVQATVGQ